MELNLSTLERIYAGYIGMVAGMRLGAPIENPYWTYERIQAYFGELHGYLRHFRHFAADDDVNGPTVFVRALRDYGGRDLTAEHAGETWLNYARCGHGMYWWGGEEFSTENRGYMNLKRGHKAPYSGSAELNGKTASEQIGGQIFSDTWGLVCPGDPKKAAELARIMASVTHDGEGLNGAAFVAGCIAAAFTAKTVDEMLDVGLAQLPTDSQYRLVMEDIRAFHRAHPEDYHACRAHVAATCGQDRFPGDYHIIPNGAIIVLALLYGDGDPGRSIEISVGCGYDTDCNASNVGTMLGVLRGIDGLPERYRGPINDSVVLSSVSGYLNMVDIPTFAKELLAMACFLRDEPLPPEVRIPGMGELLYDFRLPGSIHGLELSDYAAHELRWQGRIFHSPGGACELAIDGKNVRPCDVFFYANHVPEDFNEDRYEQIFSPRVYPGQRVSACFRSQQVAAGTAVITPWMDTVAGERMELASHTLPEGAWTEISFTVPDLHGTQLHRVGWSLDVRLAQPPWSMGRVYIDDISVTGDMDYTIDIARQTTDFNSVTPFSFNDGEAKLRDGQLVFASRRDAQGFTGNYYMADTEISASVIPGKGGAMLLLRGEGCRRYYALGLPGDGTAAIVKYDSGVRTVLAQRDLPAGFAVTAEHRIGAEARGEELSLTIDGATLLRCTDTRYARGMAGIAHEDASESVWSDFRIRASL